MGQLLAHALHTYIHHDTYTHTQTHTYKYTQQQPLVVQQAAACASSLPTTPSTNTPLAAHFANQGGEEQPLRPLQANIFNTAAAAGKKKKKKKKPFYLVTGSAPVHPVVIEAVARLRGVNNKQQKHVLLRGAANEDEEEDYTHTHTHTQTTNKNVDFLLHQAAPTPECLTASLTATKLYTEGEIPSYFLNMTTTTTITTTSELLTPSHAQAQNNEENKEEEEDEEEEGEGEGEGHK